VQVSPASRRNSVLFGKRSTRLVAGALMKAKGFLLMTTLLISGCAQVNDQFYSKKNFTSESFRADASDVNARIHPSSQFKATSRTVKIAHRISTMQWSATA
jgi:hypothetical protein